jgi:hypothetical protein
MFRNKSRHHISGLLYSLFFGPFCGVVVCGVWPDAPLFLKTLIVVAFVVSFYFVGVWVVIRGELNQRLPTPSHELRSRKKVFYDWLDSQSRR